MNVYTVFNSSSASRATYTGGSESAEPTQQVERQSFCDKVTAYFKNLGNSRWALGIGIACVVAGAAVVAADYFTGFLASFFTSGAPLYLAYSLLASGTTLILTSLIRAA